MQTVGYDPGRRHLVFIDHAVVQKNIGKGSVPIPVARLVVVDAATREARVVLTLPRKGLFPRIALAARGDGTWVLVGQVKQSNAWTTFQFALDHSAELTWRGLHAGSGLVLDGPINTSDRLFLPVRRESRHDFERPEAVAFNFLPAGPTDL